MEARGRKKKHYDEIPFELIIDPGYLKRQDTTDTTLLTPPPPGTIAWLSLFFITLAGFIIGLVGLLTPHYMAGEIDLGQNEALPGIIKNALDLEQDVPENLKMADFGLFKFCFSDDFLVIVRQAMKFGGGEMPVNEGGMKLDFSHQCHKVIETENQPELMKARTRTGKILMFLGLSSVFVTWLFVILVLVAGRHLSKVITGISASVSVAFLVSSLLVSMTLRKMTKDYLNLEIMKSVKLSIADMGIKISFVEMAIGGKLEMFQPVEVVPGYSGFLIVASAILLMVVGITSLLKAKAHRPG